MNKSRIAQAFRDRGLRAEDVATRLGISVATVRGYYCGTVMSDRRAELFAGLLGITFDEFRFELSPRAEPIYARQVLRDRGITVLDFAAELGLHRNWVSEVVNGIRPAGPKISRAMEEALGLPAEILCQPVAAMVPEAASFGGDEDA